ncbi:cytochrome c-550 PedF [Colwellia sp. 4_MG-2023]|jgi:cytochrome c-550 PedF|uniref:cytochrome c-550 PedF n=1 Tax=unclassified Colwellia TaxID=196834 RepID=UPI001C080C9A|nr:MULTISPECIES: cytochrome c-550 PedF [unclassified Colwellia]MBU2924534.1 cytochrome c-550 PedF [Colwellia sp. C2M11]MDO6487597.1 cytochrome c-550 PedF [Colwellia sp. 6_MG-2023]MDO6507326.1 cytochrome c-550 PedF [Colwellia sp. 5_MG-2023]MDO6556059.1 cytochrome c-550 PedF [Colwellia sp. 4_MG-2023]MDO6652945.1 cytochrome c-550 PedF [Colwellia sp. 3_MG-2023]
MIKFNLGLSQKCLITLISVCSFSIAAHGPVTPQAINTSTLPTLGEEWFDTNPYREKEGDVLTEILRVGASAYNQNCARCHGLGGVSGGIAPDIRKLPADFDGDEWYIYRVQNGAVRNGAVYMPKMTEHLNQEALWAIRTWLESVSEK